MPRNKVPVSEMGVVNSHREGMRAHIQFRADDEENNIFMDQIAQPMRKLKKTWTKFVRLGVLDGIAKKVSKLWEPKPTASKYRLSIKVKYNKLSNE